MEILSIVKNENNNIIGCYSDRNNAENSVLNYIFNKLNNYKSIIELKI